jgi:hypothetical protein
VGANGTSVSRWKARLRACQIMEFRSWLAGMEAIRTSPVAAWERKGFWVSFRRFRQDATNADFWKGNKLSVTELFYSSHSRPIFSSSSWDDVSRTIETKCILGDLKPVSASSTGLSCLGTVEAQIKSVACDSCLPWLDTVKAPELASILDDAGPTPMPLEDAVVSAAPAVPEQQTVTRVLQR